MELNILFWDKYESRHKRIKDCSLDHIGQITNEIEREVNLRMWEDLPPFEATPPGPAQRLAWRLAFMTPRWGKIGLILHRFGVRV